MTNDHEPTSMSEQLFSNLRHISHAMHNQHLARGSQKRILIILSRSGKTTQKVITERLGIKAGSASEVISRMEAAGLVVRTTNPDDQRAVDIELTPLGVETAESVKDEARRQHEEMFACLTETEQRDLLRITDKISALWAESISARPSKNR